MVELVLGVVGALFVFAAYSDIKSRRIPNWVSLLVVGLFCLASAFEPERIKPFDGLLLGAMVLAIGFVMFGVGLIGGGDAKLAAAAGPWVGVSYVAEFAVVTALVGGALGLALAGAAALRSVGTSIGSCASRLGFDRVARRASKDQISASGRPGARALSGVPYGVAIGTSAFVVMAQRFVLEG